jgi:hypothetical protein
LSRSNLFITGICWFLSVFHEIVRRNQMNRNKRLVLAAAVAGATALTSISAEAFFGPFNFMRGWGGGGPWGWGGPWGGYGWGYPYYGGWGYPYYGGWGGYPYYGGWGGYPLWGGAPYLTYPTVAAPAAPASSSDK